MSIKTIFSRKPNKFIQLLVQQTNLTAHGLALLKTYMEKRDHGVAAQISRTEKEADEIRRILIEELMRTFITPFDREDIFAISREVDDVLDYADTTVDEMEILDVPTTPYMLRMTSLLHDAAQEIDLAVAGLFEQGKVLLQVDFHAEQTLFGGFRSRPAGKGPREPG